ncbi:hypothetical protein GL50803_0039210 [Giardia duodenalis]|uniref:Uncharacterized protein n=1 Tax=Giardia intestinalis (strain ATCC 50803 / WB clone C6) TaxID=184922 RepID=A0A644EXQ8_GIAIC|nr:hypothetical protein GL50803_0039210 [Giardia intestinalis]KAE8301238.1 hypothetical protein GL50803_0039210 [Giardia intestinalis]
MPLTPMKLIRDVDTPLGAQRIYWSVLSTNMFVDQSHEHETRGAILSLILRDSFILELANPTSHLVSTLIRPDVITNLSLAAFSGQYNEEGIVFTTSQEKQITDKLPAIFSAMLRSKPIRDAYLSSAEFQRYFANGVEKATKSLMLGYQTYEDLHSQFEIIKSILTTLAEVSPKDGLSIVSHDQYSPLLNLLSSDKFCAVVPLLQEDASVPLTFMYSLFRYLSKLLQMPIPHSDHVTNICTSLTLLFSKYPEDLNCFYDQVFDIATHMARHIAQYSQYDTFVMDIINLIATYFSLSLSAETLRYNEEDLRKTATVYETSISIVDLIPLAIPGMSDVIKLVIAELHSTYQCCSGTIVQQLSFRQVYYILVLVARFFCCFGELKEAILLGDLVHSYVPEYDSIHVKAMEMYIASESSRAEMNSTAYLGCGGTSEWLSPENAAKVLRYSPIMGAAASLCCKELLEFMSDVSSSARFINCNMILCPLTRIRNSMLELGAYDNSLYYMCFYETGLIDRMQYYLATSKPKTVGQRPAEIAYLTCTVHKAMDYSIGTTDRAVFKSRREGFNLMETFSSSDPIPCESIWELINDKPITPTQLYSILTRGELSALISSYLEMYDAYSIFSRRFPDNSMMFELSLSSTIEASDLYTASSILAPSINITPYEKTGTPISKSAKKLRSGSNQSATQSYRNELPDPSEEFLQCARRSQTSVADNLRRSKAPQRRVTPPGTTASRSPDGSIYSQLEPGTTLDPPRVPLTMASRVSRASVSRASSSYQRASVVSTYSQLSIGISATFPVHTDSERGVSRSSSRAVWVATSWNESSNMLPMEAGTEIGRRASNIIRGC